MRIVLVAALLAAATASAQKLYKWVDEKGVTHYSESPPADKGESARFQHKVAPGNAVAPEDWKQRELEWRKQKVDRDSKDRPSDDAAARDKARRCRTAQAQLDQLRNTRRIYRLDDKGERVYVEDDQRPELMDKAQREIRESCP